MLDEAMVAVTGRRGLLSQRLTGCRLLPAASLPRCPPSPVPCSCTSSPPWQHRVCTAAGLPDPASAPSQPGQARPAKAQVPRPAQPTQTEPTGVSPQKRQPRPQDLGSLHDHRSGRWLGVECHVSGGACRHGCRHLRVAGGDGRCALPCRPPTGSPPPALWQTAAWLWARRDSYRPRPRRCARGRHSCHPGPPATRSRLRTRARLRVRRPHGETPESASPAAR